METTYLRKATTKPTLATLPVPLSTRHQMVTQTMRRRIRWWHNSIPSSNSSTMQLVAMVLLNSIQQRCLRPRQPLSRTMLDSSPSSYNNSSNSSNSNTNNSPHNSNSSTRTREYRIVTLIIANSFNNSKMCSSSSSSHINHSNYSSTLPSTTTSFSNSPPRTESSRQAELMASAINALIQMAST